MIENDTFFAFFAQHHNAVWASIGLLFLFGCALLLYAYAAQIAPSWIAHAFPEKKSTQYRLFVVSGAFLLVALFLVLASVASKHPAFASYLAAQAYFIGIGGATVGCAAGLVILTVLLVDWMQGQTVAHSRVSFLVGCTSLIVGSIILFTLLR
jgi:hypothetical protein